MKLTAREGWCALGVFVVVFDRFAPETLSSEFVAHRKNPLVVAAWAVTTLHLFGALSPRADPFVALMKLMKKVDDNLLELP